MVNRFKINFIESFDESQIDAAVIVVDRLGQVDDLDAARLLGQTALVLVQEVGGLERVVAADRDQRVDLEIDQRVVDVAQPLGALGIGAVVGALFIPGLKQRFSLDLVVTATLVCFSLCTLGVSQWDSMLLDDLFLIVGGVSWSIMTVTHQVAVQFCSPDWVRGRTTSFYMLTLQGATALGSLTFGWVAQLTTIRESIMLCAK